MMMRDFHDDVPALRSEGGALFFFLFPVRLEGGARAYMPMSTSRVFSRLIQRFGTLKP